MKTMGEHGAQLVEPGAFTRGDSGVTPGARTPNSRGRNRSSMFGMSKPDDQALQGVLSKYSDTDKLTKGQVKEIVEDLVKAEQITVRWKKYALLLATLFVLALVGNFALAIVANQLAQNTKVSDPPAGLPDTAAVLQTTSGQDVATHVASTLFRGIDLYDEYVLVEDGVSVGVVPCSTVMLGFQRLHAGETHGQTVVDTGLDSDLTLETQ
eukprot:4390771-Prymnesium_polylepis.2